MLVKTALRVIVSDKGQKGRSIVIYSEEGDLIVVERETSVHLDVILLTECSVLVVCS